MSKQLPVLIPERMTIENAREIQKQLLEALENSGVITIDFEKVEVIDLAGIQLLLALFREAEKRKIVITCSDMIPEQVVAKLRLFGFCNDSCTSAEKLCEALSSFFNR